jgi:hypothetical protein
MWADPFRISIINVLQRGQTRSPVTMVSIHGWDFQQHAWGGCAIPGGAKSGGSGSFSSSKYAAARHEAQTHTGFGADTRPGRTSSMHFAQVLQLTQCRGGFGSTAASGGLFRNQANMSTVYTIIGLQPLRQMLTTSTFEKLLPRTLPTVSPSSLLTS